MATSSAYSGLIFCRPTTISSKTASCYRAKATVLLISTVIRRAAAIGGPIKKDKLFFFADYEDTQQQQFEGLKTFTVPTSAERTGDFSALLNHVDPDTGLPAPITIYDPTLPDNPDGTRQAFPGNIIPNPNPIGLLYLSKMP